MNCPSCRERSCGYGAGVFKRSNRQERRHQHIVSIFQRSPTVQRVRESPAFALAALDNEEVADLSNAIALVVRSTSNSILLIIYYYFPIQNLTIVSIFFKFVYVYQYAKHVLCYSLYEQDQNESTSLHHYTVCYERSHYCLVVMLRNTFAVNRSQFCSNCDFPEGDNLIWCLPDASRTCLQRQKLRLRP